MCLDWQWGDEGLGSGSSIPGVECRAAAGEEPLRACDANPEAPVWERCQVRARAGPEALAASS